MRKRLRRPSGGPSLREMSAGRSAAVCWGLGCGVGCGGSLSSAVTRGAIRVLPGGASGGGFRWPRCLSVVASGRDGLSWYPWCHTVFWGSPFEDAAGSGVEKVFDAAEFFYGMLREVGAFREVLAQQAVGVFVGGSLPGGVGVAEVDGDAGAFGGLSVVGHFAALVPGQGAAQGGGQVGELGGQCV